MSVAALILGAGQGSRVGAGDPKALLRLAGRSVLAWSAQALARARGVEHVLCVVPPGAERTHSELRRRWEGPAGLLEPIPGGATRQASLGAGLTALERAAPDVEWVLVHDAARCLVEPSDAERVLAAARATGAAIPALPVEETVKEVSGEQIVRTPPREGLVVAQTPQAFRRALLVEALDKAARDGFTGTDCASLVERLGVRVRVVAGRAGNWKLTHAADLARAEAALRARGSLA